MTVAQYYAYLRTRNQGKFGKRGELLTSKNEDTNYGGLT